MGEQKILHTIAESCPFDVLLAKQMKSAVNSLFQLNLERFRIPEKVGTKYSALDIMKQALELLYEFSPSERNYREAMRTIQVYSEGDTEMLQTLQSSFRLIANAVYSAYAGQRQAESLAPNTLFLQGIPFEQADLQQSFRFFGVRPPDVSPPSVKETVFLDEGFEPYRKLLEGKLTTEEAQVGREEHWTQVIETTLSNNDRTALLRVGAEHVVQSRSHWKQFARSFRSVDTGKVPDLLRKRGIDLKIIHRIADVNEVFGKT